MIAFLKKKIEEGLSKLSGKNGDGQRFEKYVQSHFQGNDSLPGFVPAGGTGDFGVDGTFRIKVESTGILTCTIQSDVKANMLKSIKKYKESEAYEGSGKYYVAVATSQELSGKKQDNLWKAAKKEGFEVHQIFDRKYFVNALYKDPEWCRDLLGISGTRSALSKKPLNNRAYADISLVGRDAEAGRIAELENDSGDILITGQPGSGKTYLANAFVKNHETAYFVVSDDMERICDGIREETPDFLIIDDIHSKKELFAKLDHLRDGGEGFQFRMIGTAWSSEAENVKRFMRLADKDVIGLKDLTRDDIVEIIDAYGLENADDGLKKRIVDQAGGKPGLAVTLCNLCLKDGWRKVFNGEALYSEVTQVFKERLGDEVVTLLSFIALGGDEYLSLEKLKEMSGMDLPSVRRHLDELGFGGVISTQEVGGLNSVRVEPGILRYPLIQDLFFPDIGKPELQFEAYIKYYPSRNEVIKSLIITALRGGTLNPLRIQSYFDKDLEERNSNTFSWLLPGIPDEIWSLYAALGEHWAEYVQEKNKDAIANSPGPLLFSRKPGVSEIAVEVLLKAASDVEESAGNYRYKDPFNVLERWVEGKAYSTDDFVARRRTLVESIKMLVDSGFSDGKVIAKALAISLSPRIEYEEMSPGSGLKLSFRMGVLNADALRKMEPVVKKAVSLFKKLEDKNALSELFSVTENYVYNFNIPREGSSDPEYEEIVQEQKKLAKLLLDGLWESADKKYFLRRHLKKLFPDLGADKPFDPVTELDILFPPFDPDNKSNLTEPPDEDAALEIRKIAQLWAVKDPQVAAEEYEAICAEVQAVPSVGTLFFPRSLLFARELCAVLPSEQLMPWADQLIKHPHTTVLTENVLKRIAEEKLEGYRNILTAALQDKFHRVSASEAVFEYCGLEKDRELLAAAGEQLPNNSWVLSRIINLQRPGIILFLLKALESDSETVIKFCWHINNFYEGKPIPELFESTWRKIVINYDYSGYSGNSRQHAKQILRSHPELVLPWFEKGIKRDKEEGLNFIRVEVAEELVGSLSFDERKNLISLLDPANTAEFAVLLVGDKPELYRELLKNSEAKELHLYPLDIEKGNWTEMAGCAFKAGYPKKDALEYSVSYFLWKSSWDVSNGVAPVVEGKMALMERHKAKTNDDDILDIVDKHLKNLRAELEWAKKQDHRQKVEGLRF